jgi:hypothetical protein
MAQTRSVWTAIKEAVGALRELIIVLVILGLALGLSLWPDHVKDRLVKAGFKSADVAGLHWEPELLEASEQTNEARQNVALMEQRLLGFKDQLQGISDRVQDPAVEQDVRQLTENVDKSIEETRSIDRGLKASADVQESVLRLAVPQKSEEGGAWAIVVSADRALNQAKHEVRRARTIGYSSVEVFERGGLYRTVIEFPDKAEARKALAKIRRELKDSAYLVDLEAWCPTREQRDADGVWVCGPSVD